MSVSVQIDTTKLDELIKTVPGNKSKVVRSCAYHILGNARKKAPHITGDLRDNSAVVENGDSASIEFYAEYAGYVELGTYKMYARPFLKTSIETERQNFIERLKKEVIK